MFSLHEELVDMGWLREATWVQWNCLGHFIQNSVYHTEIYSESKNQTLSKQLEVAEHLHKCFNFITLQKGTASTSLLVQFNTFVYYLI